MGDRPTLTGPAEPAPMGRTVGRGALWMGLNSIGAKVIGFLLQIALGRLLSQDDFGVYAIAISLAMFVQSARDGGVIQLLIQRGTREYESLRGPAFWLGLAMNLLAAALLLAATPLLARYYGEQVVQLCWFIAVSIPLSTPSAIARARLSMQLRFGDLARMQLASALLRSALVLALAWTGFGPFSFVIPLVVIAIFDGAYGFILTRDRPWNDAFGASRWWSYLRDTRWLMLNALAIGTNNMGAYFIMGLLLDEGTVGVFFFAFQLAAQSSLLLASNFYATLFPALARLNDHRERQQDALVRAMRTFMLINAPLSIGLAVIIGPLEHLLWGGRWAASVTSVIILSFTFPFRALLSMVIAYLHARGQFRLQSLLEVGQAAGLLVTVTAASITGNSATAIAWWVGAYLLVTGVAVAVPLLRSLRVPASQHLPALFAAWTICAAIGAGCLLLDARLLGPLSPAIRCVVLAVTFGVLCLIALRIWCRDDLRAAIAVLPRPRA